MSQGKPTIYILLGVPGSGKSYFAQNLASVTGAVHLSSDAMRMAIFKSRKETDKIYHSEDRAILNSYTFGALDYAAKAALLGGVSVVYDACNNTQRERREITEVMMQVAESIVVWIKTPQDVAVQRAIARRETSSDRKLSPDEALKYIKKIASEIEAPSDNEKSIVLDGTVLFEDQYESFKNQLMEIAGE